MMKPLNKNYLDAPSALCESSHVELIRSKDIALNLQVYHDATICPYSANHIGCCGEVLLFDGTIAMGINSHFDYDAVHEIGNFPIAVENENEIIYLGSLPVCWGHYITDGLSKLWFFYTDEGKELLQRGVRVGITTCYVNMDSVPKAYQYIVNVLGLPIKVEVITDVTHYKTVYCPDNSLFVRGGTRYYLKEQNEIIDRLIESVQTEGKCFCSFEKIYFSLKSACKLQQHS